jgi:hypothetical protein
MTIRHVVLDQQDGHALLTNLPDETAHHRLLGAGHAGARLVQQQQARARWRAPRPARRAACSP